MDVFSVVRFVVSLRYHKTHNSKAATYGGVSASMSFYIILYGVASPSSIREHSTNALMVVLALFFCGVYSDFIPSENWSEVGWYISFFLGVSVSIYTLRAYWTGRAEFKPGTSKMGRGLIYVLIPFFFVFFIWVALTHGVASLVTLAFGYEVETTYNLKKVRESGRRTCDYKLKGKSLNRAFPSYICIEEYKYNRLPEEAEYIIQGHENFLGFVADAVHLGQR